MDKIKTAIATLIDKPKEQGIILNPPATENDITVLSNTLQCEIPSDIRFFYSCCNGIIDTSDFLFQILSIRDILKNLEDLKTQSFHFAEYMIFSDVWTITISDNEYVITNSNHGEDDTVVLTTNISEFLLRYAKGGLFEKDSLYDWYEERKQIKGSA